MSEREQHQIVGHELSILSAAIDYAQRELSSESRLRGAYEEFLRVAWGKGIRVRSSTQGMLIFRVSQAAAPIAVAGSSIATPASPIGRVVNIAQVGQTRESDRLGEYTVEAVWYFARYRGTEYRRQIKNFQRMVATGALAFTVEDLRAWFERTVAAQLATMQVEVPGDDYPTPVHEADALAQGSEDATVDQVHFADSGSMWDVVEIDNMDFPDAPGTDAPTSGSETIALAPDFYVNLSEAQYEAAHWGANGLVYVEGIAGSGKTSVALGRTKALVQLGQLPADDPGFNPHFAEETQLGVVRTSELINYLRATCDSLSLHRLPIVEFAEVRERLRNHWRVGEASRSGRRWTFEHAPEGSLFCSSVEELQGVVSATVRALSRRLSQSLMDWQPEPVSGAIDGNVFDRICDVARSAMANVPESTDAIGFLERWSSRVRAAIDELLTRRVWVGVPTKSGYEWSLDHRHGLVGHLFRPGETVCLFRSATSFEFLVPNAGSLEEWRRHLPDGAVLHGSPADPAGAYAAVRASDGQAVNVTVRAIHEDDLMLRLPDAQLRYFDGVRAGNLSLRSREVLIVNLAGPPPSDQGAKSRSWARSAVQRMQGRIDRQAAGIEILDVYLEALSALQASGHVREHQATGAVRIGRLGQRILDTDDIDVVLAILAVLTHGERESVDTPFRYLPPPYHSAVFIDEIQDFAPAEILLLTLLASPAHNSVTAVGDPAQRLRPQVVPLDGAIPHFLWRTAHRERLETNIRQQNAPALRDLSANFRALMIDSGAARPSQAEAGGRVVFLDSQSDLERRATRVLDALSGLEGTGTVVVLTATEEGAIALANAIREPVFGQLHRPCAFSSTLDLTKRYLVHVSTPRHVKGLEFDHAVICGVEDFDLTQEHERNALYVALTRPGRSLQLIGERGEIAQELLRIIDAATRE